MLAFAVRFRAAAFVASFFLLGAFCVAEAAAAPPSFDCKRVTSQVNQMICASEELSALDRKLSSDFEATLHQGNINGKQLQTDELRWLRDIRNQCTTESCLKEAYLTRDAAILDRSLRAASPVVYEDTRPFPVPAAVLAAARTHVGTSCGAGPREPLPGTSIIGPLHMIATQGGYIVPLTVEGYLFAFWFAQSDPNATCTVRDVVVLPSPMLGKNFMQCHLGNDSHGFAVRTRAGKVLAYWSISKDQATIERQPIHVLGEQDLRCQQPETGE
jgi:uncharacterized protein